MTRTRTSWARGRDDDFRVLGLGFRGLGFRIFLLAFVLLLVSLFTVLPCLSYEHAWYDYDSHCDEPSTGGCCLLASGALLFYFLVQVFKLVFSEEFMGWDVLGRATTSKDFAESVKEGRKDRKEGRKEGREQAAPKWKDKMQLKYGACPLAVLHL